MSQITARQKATASGIININGDTGTTVTGGTISIDAGQSTLLSGSTVFFNGASSSELQLNVTDADFNTIVGNSSGNASITGSFNTGFGSEVLMALSTGADNVAVGGFVLAAETTGSNNTAVGSESMASADGSNHNTAIGYASLSNLVTGSLNIAIGYEAGSGYTGSESQNIVIGANGSPGDNGVLNIGAGNLGSAYIGGINGVTVTTPVMVVIDSSTEQLGTAPIPSPSNLAYTLVNTTPYVVLSTDDFMGVDCSGSAITIELPDAPSTGRTFVIKDITGSAATNNITVTTVSGIVLVDGSTSYIMNTNLESVTVLFSGSAYYIF